MSVNEHKGTNENDPLPNVACKHILHIHVGLGMTLHELVYYVLIVLLIWKTAGISSFVSCFIFYYQHVGFVKSFVVLV